MESGEGLRSDQLITCEYNQETIACIATEWQSGQYRGLIFLDFDGVFFGNLQFVDPNTHPLIAASRNGTFPYEEKQLRKILRMETYKFLPPDTNTVIYRHPADEQVIPELTTLREAGFLIVGLTAQPLKEAMKSQTAIEGYLGVSDFYTLSAYFETKGKCINDVLSTTGDVPLVYALDDREDILEEIKAWGQSRTIQISAKAEENTLWWGEIAQEILGK